MTSLPACPAGRGRSADKSVVATAAAATGTGSAGGERDREAGAYAVIGDRHEQRPPAADLPHRARHMTCDATDQRQVDGFLGGAVAWFGRIDVMINNARGAFGRAARPGEVAHVRVFLASDHASYLTGEVVSAGSRYP